jgi:hypothetical protein
MQCITSTSHGKLNEIAQSGIANLGDQIASCEGLAGRCRSTSIAFEADFRLASRNLEVASPLALVGFA